MPPRRSSLRSKFLSTRVLKFLSTRVLRTLFSLAATLVGVSGARAEAQGLVRLEGVKGEVREVQQEGNTIWLAVQDPSTNEGRVYFAYSDSFMAEDLKPADEVLAEKDQPSRAFNAIERVGTQIWLGASDGIFWADGEYYRRVAVEPEKVGKGEVFFLERDTSGLVWIGSASGLYYVEPRQSSTAVKVPIPHDASHGSEQITALKILPQGDEILVGNGDGIFRGGKKSLFTKIHQDPFSAIGDVVQDGNSLLVLSSTDSRWSIRRLDETRFSPPLLEEGVDDLCLMNSEVWVIVNGKVHLSEFGQSPRERPVKLDTPSTTNNFISCGGAGDFAFVISGKEVYRKDGASGRLSLFARDSQADNEDAFDLATVEKVGADVFLYGRSGAYRLIEDLEPKVALDKTDTWLGGKVRVSRVAFKGRQVPENATFKLMLYGEKSAFDAERFQAEKYKELDLLDELTLFTKEADIWIGIVDNHGTLFSLTEKVTFEKSAERALAEGLGFVVLGALTVSLTLRLVFPWLWARVLWLLARSPKGNPDTRLRSYISTNRYFRKYVLYSAQLEPPPREMQRTFREIYVDMLSTGDTLTGDPWADSVLKSLECSSDRSLSLSPLADVTEAAENLQQIIGIGKRFAIHTPVVVHLEYHPDEITNDGVRHAVIETLNGELPYGDHEFYEDQLAKGAFIFIVVVSSASVGQIQATRAFFRSGGQKRNYLAILGAK